MTSTSDRRRRPDRVGFLQLTDESGEPVRSRLSLRPTQLAHELETPVREVERDRLLQQLPAEPSHHCPLGPRISVLGVEHDEL